MFSHVFLGVSDFDRALAFYDALMAVLGHARRFCERQHLAIAWLMRRAIKWPANQQ